MATLHPVYVSPMQWFYPIGNAAANCLTRDLPPGKSARCLLLGNGDARNIFYTLFSDESHGSSYVLTMLTI